MTPTLETDRSGSRANSAAQIPDRSSTFAEWTTQSARLTSAGLTLDLDPSIGSLTQRLMAALRTGVQHGQLPAGLALPPSRALAAELGCSRWVVTEAYAQLVSRGLSGRRLPGRPPGSGRWARRHRSPRPPPLPPPRPRLDLLPGTSRSGRVPAGPLGRGVPPGDPDDAERLLAGRSLLATLSARTALTDHLRRTRQVQEDPTPAEPEHRLDGRGRLAGPGVRRPRPSPDRGRGPVLAGSARRRPPGRA